MPKDETANLPKVEARVGDTLATLRERSTYRFDFSRLTDDDLTNATSPCVFSYAGLNGFALPPTRFVSISAIAALIVDIKTSPQLDYLEQREVLELASRVAETIRSAGWRPSLARVTTREELAVRLKDESTPEQQSWILDSFASGTLDIDLRLRRIHRKRGALASAFGRGDQFLLNVQLYDEALAKRARQIAMKIREQDGVSVDSLGRSIDLDRYVRRLNAELVQH